MSTPVIQSAIVNSRPHIIEDGFITPVHQSRDDEDSPVYSEMMKPSQAARVLGRWDGRIPSDYVELTNLAAAFHVTGDTVRARAFAIRALAAHRSASTLLNLAIVLEMTGRFTEALALAHEANALDPADPYVGSLYSDGLIRLGMWDDGWGLYARYHADFTWLRTAIPEWDGRASLARKRVLVIEGGGYGDNILHVRWIAELASRGACVSYMCPRPFASLAARIPGVTSIVPTDNGTMGELRPADYDYFVPLLALAAKLHVTLRNLARTFTYPYLTADPAATRVRETVLRRSCAPRVGLCARAGENVSPRKHRSLDEVQRRQIIASVLASGADIVNLTYDLPMHDPGGRILEPSIRDWSDTASVVACCDLVVSVDTGVAHLAGALGRPTIVLVPGISAWPWLTDRSDSPFYPSARVFRTVGEGIQGAVDLACTSLAQWRLE